MNKQADIIILGAGLSGLALAYYLKKEGKKALILEARKRIGGRILTQYHEDKAPVEMGATWLGKKHIHLVALLGELGLEVFPQEIGATAIYEPISTSPPQLAQLPPNPDPSYRIKGGSSALIHTLAEQLDADQIQLEQTVRSITKENDGLTIVTKTDTFSAQKLVSTLPPRLLLKSIDLQPRLPEELNNIAELTHTWMGESIKVGLTFEKPFWRAANTSGTIFSNVGPITEFYDHSDAADKVHALKGFMNGAYHSASRTQRLELILNQLRKYYGEQVDQYLDYQERVWAHEPFTYTPYDGYILPHQNNGNPIFRQAYWDGQLWIAGAETAAQFPGYMDGAVQSAQFVAKAL